MRILLNLENPESETMPMLTDVQTPKDIAEAMLELANLAVAQST